MSTQSSPHAGRFQAELNRELEQFLKAHAARFPMEEVRRMDMHCHNRNSDKPTEQIGRILNRPILRRFAEEIGRFAPNCRRYNSTIYPLTCWYAAAPWSPKSI